MNHHAMAEHGTTGTFDRDVTGLPAATPTEIVELADGATFRLNAAPIQQQIGGAPVRMLAYNGSVPGPTLRVRQGSSLSVEFANHADLANTVHWHGLRVDNRSDGTHQTQPPVPVGGRFRYDLRFPDPGIYWYHPHVREDYGQELGLYGAIVVESTDPAYWPPAHRELVLTLDDLLVEDGQIATFDRDKTTFSAMGRFGNVFLTGGAEQPVLAARRDEVVRFYLINVANARVFNVAVPGGRIKLVGGDSGRVEREAFVESVVLAPSERAVVDVHFPTPGRFALEHRTPTRTYPLAAIEVDAEVATPALAEAFSALRRNPEWAAERERLAAFADAAPDKTLAFVAEMDMGGRSPPSTHARCIRRWFPTPPAAARSAAWRCCRRPAPRKQAATTAVAITAPTVRTPATRRTMAMRCIPGTPTFTRGTDSAPRAMLTTGCSTTARPAGSNGRTIWSLSTG